MDQPLPPHRRTGDWLQLAGLLLALALLGGLGASLPVAGRVPVPGGDGMAAGDELRRLAAQVLWLRGETMHHAGVEEREAREGEARSREGEIHSHGDGHDHEDHGGHVLVIPPAREDFRGVLGDLEREIKPYLDRDGKLRELSPTQLLPLYRLMTWADPHSVRGYLMGAFAIVHMEDDSAPGPRPAASHQATLRSARVKEAIEFLKEGERSNPDSFEIQEELGRYYFFYWKMYGKAEEHLRRAIELAPRGRELTEDEQIVLADSYRWLARTYSHWKRPEQAVQVAREGLRVIGPDYTLEQLIRRGGAP